MIDIMSKGKSVSVAGILMILLLTEFPALHAQRVELSPFIG
jgi:hypothetical protein